MANIGMMDGAYFVGRAEILAWVNSTCSTNLTKVEQAASGAVYCALLEATNPGTIRMDKVTFGTGTQRNASFQDSIRL